MIKRDLYYTASRPLKVAFIYDAEIDDSRWVDGHEAGRLYAQEKLGNRVSTDFYVKKDGEEGIQEAAKRALKDKCSMIFTVSPDMLNDTLKLSVDNPDVKFLNCSLDEAYSGVRSYGARFYEASFLCGILAGQSLLTHGDKCHTIGYLSDRPTPGKISNINAFALGAAMIDPDCRISLKWSSLSSYDECMDEWERGGIRLWADNEYSPDKADMARKRGVYLNNDDGGRTFLGAPYYVWGRYYAGIIQSVLEDTWDISTAGGRSRSSNYYFGLSTGVTDIRLGDVPYQVRRLIGFMRNAIIEGAVNPFSGEIHSRDRLILGDHESKTADSGSGKRSIEVRDIINMDWLNDNVDGIIPKEA